MRPTELVRAQAPHLPRLQNARHEALVAVARFWSMMLPFAEDPPDAPAKPLHVIPCDRCAQRPATRVVAHPQLGHNLPLRLCDDCAQDLPVQEGLTLFQVQLPALVTCPRCGTAFQSICQSTVLGCSHCYQHYRVHLESLVLRVQGSDRHLGKIPERRGRSLHERRVIGSLKERLREAVEAERYEEAAQLRDQIRELTHE